ncbi:exosome component 10-like [Dreissena polymorpha]|uniref:exosome component 10-like n=1 Tax=Dreissena polymorpha TaxID=45954 RepID=UPI002263E49B|nr:exosome component 10-like [Dreissena polymorpha]
MSESPEFLYPHPYQYELDNLTFTADQLKGCDPQEPGSLTETPCTLVKIPEQLEPLVNMLKKQTEIAVDLEHHSYRTFLGITCLMQISTRSHDYLVDTLELRGDLQCLNTVFTDPNIVKVFHGADMDIEWLQRDLGLYVVNMFDTGQAARVLNCARFSLAYLLQQYCDVDADKQYQMADWRMRPLPEELQKYAREDTHYLLYIYDRMRNELIERGNNSNNMLLSVMHRSKQVCAKVYKKPYGSPDAYIELYKKNKKVFNSQQLLAFKELFKWRDETARMEDESCGYVLPNHMLLQICDILPRERPGVLACCNPIPPLVRQYLNEIHTIIMKAREAPLTKVDVVREQRPTNQQHPKYNVDTLLTCPHDLSHQGSQMDQESSSCLLNDKMVAASSSLFPAAKTGISISHRISVKETPTLSAFGNKPVPRSTVAEIKTKVAQIKASFVSPYCMYLLEPVKSSVVKPATLNINQSASNTSDLVTDSIMNSWKLLPCSVKRKPEVTDSPSTAAPPSKRSRTDLHQVATSKHIKFNDEGEAIEVSEDDKKALPQDIEIPLRFQMPSKSKKKKNRNRDIDIIQSVQEHLSNIRKLQEESELALGENPEDEKPVVVEQAKKTNKTFKQYQSKQLKKSEKSGTSGSHTKLKKPETGNGNKDKMKQQEKNKSQSKNGGKKQEEAFTSSVTIEIDSRSGSDVEIVKEEFKPYDYTQGAKSLKEDSGKKAKGGDYYNPHSKDTGKGKSMTNKAFKKGQKSFTWKNK